MAKSAPRQSSKPARATKKSAAKPKISSLEHGLVAFSFQNIDYHIDVERSKVYRRFIEVEKSRTNSIITAYRAGSIRPRPTL